jgi:hypothetical protein
MRKLTAAICALILANAMLLVVNVRGASAARQTKWCVEHYVGPGSWDCQCKEGFEPECENEQFCEESVDWCDDTSPE